MEYIYKKILKYDNTWCKFMGFQNPYLDNISQNFTRKLPMFDRPAYNLHPKWNFVYDKLWVTESQSLNGGTIGNIRKTSHINYPIFIKPRWGHESASSKNCFKINSYEELQKYKHLDDMMWSEYIDGVENMTDFILINGNIVYELTYLYSKEQNGYTEVYKYISPNNECPKHIRRWVKQYLNGYTGAVNVQYRDNYIIEVGLRLARGGAYLQATQNPDIIDLVNDAYDSNSYNPVNRQDLNFKPYYSFKCFTRFPIIYLFPQYFMDIYMKLIGSKNFYEYYFEPNGNDGCVFFQFLHENKNKGILASNVLTFLFILIQLFFIIFFISIIYILFKYKFNTKIASVIMLFTVLYLSQYINPINVHYNLSKARRQKKWL